MTEQEWLACADPTPMLEFLRGRITDPFDSLSAKSDSRGKRTSGLVSWKAAQRKLRLFACACVRRVEAIAGPDRLQAIRVSEQYADGLVDRAALEVALQPVRKLPEPIPDDADMALSVFGPTDMVWEESLVELVLCLGPGLDAPAVAKKAMEVAASSKAAAHHARRAEEMRQQAHLLRDIFGNPFRRVPLDTSWLSVKTRALARSIYENVRFADLPTLAEALKLDAGCANQELRDHCQWPLPHARGCWVVDLVLDKSS